MSNHNKMAAIALSLGVSLGTMAQSPIVYAKTMDVKEVASTTEAKEYTVSTDEELANALDAIKAQSEQEAVLTLKADLKVPTQDYKAYFGVAGKHIVVKSDGLSHKLVFEQNIGILKGDCTFDNVTVSGYKLFCGGYNTEFTENSRIYLSATLYGGGYKTTVKSTHVVIAGNGSINPSSSSGLHDVIGGSYQGSVKGDTYLEITGNIKMQGGNHLNPGCMKGDGSSGDGRNVSDVYVGGNATLIYDNKNSATASPAIEGTYGCEMKGNVTLDVRAGRVAGIVGTEEPVDKSIIRGNLHIIAGNPAYENTDRVLRLGSNWPIVGAGNLFAEEPGAVGNYAINGNITIDTYENVWDWDKGTNPNENDLPDVYGSLRGDVGGDITINAHGSHVESIYGASDSNIQGSVTINATDVELKNSDYGTKYDEGNIFGLCDDSTANGPVTVNVNGGDVGLVMATDQETVPANSSINVTGKPKIRTGILGTTASSYSKDSPVANIYDCEATIPFIQEMSQVNITDHSNVKAHDMTSDAGLLVEKDNTLTTDDNQVWIWGDTVINGTWEQLHSQIANDYDIHVMGTTKVGPKGLLINHGTSDLEGNVTNQGVIAFLGDAYLQGDFISDDGELRLPVVSENYNGSNSIDMMVKKSSTGNSKVLIVDPSDYTKAVNPQLRDNYILSNGSEDKKEKEEVIYYLQNENKKDGYFLKSTDDVGGDYTNMWQVAKVSSYKVQYEFKSGTDGKELPDEVNDLLPVDNKKYVIGSEISAKQPKKTTVKTTEGVWVFGGYEKDKLTSNEGVTFTGKWNFHPNATKLNEVPSISANDKTITVGDKFDVKKDVTAKDTEDGDLTDKIEVVKNDVDTTKPGTYEVVYKVTDSKGASKKKTVYVTVNPKMEEINWIPVISASDRVLTVGDVFNVMDGVSASDHEDGDVTGSVVVESSNVDTNTVGSYQVTYRVTDSQGASSTKTITVIVNPKMEEINWIPVISASDKVLTVGDVFNVMDGVSASDHEDGDVTGSVVVESSNVDTNTVGSYQVTYRVTDSQGASSTKTITVIVNPKMEALNEIPVINAVDKMLTVGDTFDVKKDVTASDAEDGNLTDKIEVIRNEVDTGKAGTYEVTYKVTDCQGASSTKTILVTVNPKMESLNQVPTIKAEDKTITVGDKFEVKKDVTAKDTEDGDLTDKIEVVKNDVDTTKPGTYEVVYKVTDSKGASKKKTIQVTVNPKMEMLNEVPSISANDKTITVGDKFDVKKDVTAKDTEDGDLTDKIEVVKNDVDTTKPGTYEVTYKVTDSKGASTTKTIRVTVVKKDVSTSTDKPAKPNNSGKLNTGAQTNVLLWTTSLIASGIAVIGAYRKKRKEN